MDKFEMEQYQQIRELIAELQSCFIDGDAYSRSPSSSEWRRASRLVHQVNLLCLELYGYASACRQYNVVATRGSLQLITCAKEKKEEDRLSKPIKFTKKEMESMPIQYKNLFFTENVVAHIRVRKDNLYEVRCQIDGKKITASSKNPETAKKKFIGKLHEHVAHQNEESEITAQQETKQPLFREYALQWLETVKRPTVKATTFEDYKSIFRLHLLPTFGDRSLGSITRADVQQYLNGLIDAGKSRAAHKQRQLLTSLFEYAMVDELVTRSPMQKIKLPIHESENGTALTIEEEQALVDKCLRSETLSGRAFVFILYTGIRRSELATAQIKDEWITVTSAKQRKGKTERTRRIPISPRLRKILPNLHTELETFKGLYPNRLGRTFKEWLPSHHLHELRHTFITRAQECGIPREVVSVWAGHKADNTMTTNVYTHFSEAFQLREIQKFDY